MAVSYPAPEETVVNRVMLSAWRDRGALMIQHCEDCSLAFYYPRNLCPRCWSSSLEWRASCGRGRIETFTVVHKPVDEVFAGEGNVVLAEVRVDEGVSLITRIICDDPTTLAIGRRVGLLIGEGRDRYPLPVFVPQPAD